MGIGGSIGIFALGAILTFGVNWHINGVNVQVIGVILMVAGLIGTFATASIYRRRRLPTDPIEGEEIIRERHYR